jgi:GT2 family glycosyltransferase
MNIYAITEYGHREDTIALVNSIREQDLHGAIFIGNDAYPEKQEEISGVNILNFEQNVGYTRNNNRLVEHILGLTGMSKDNALFVCNNDIVFYTDSIKELSFYAKHGKHGKVVVGPSIIIPEHYELSHHQFYHDASAVIEEKPFPLDMLSGCCMVMKPSTWKKIGGFDNDFEIWFSDDQFCIDAKKHGFQPVHLSSAIIEHKIGQSMGRSEKVMQQVMRDKETFQKKNPGLIWSPIGTYTR